MKSPFDLELENVWVVYVAFFLNLSETFPKVVECFRSYLTGALVTFFALLFLASWDWVPVAFPCWGSWVIEGLDLTIEGLWVAPKELSPPINDFLDFSEFVCICDMDWDEVICCFKSLDAFFWASYLDAWDYLKVFCFFVVIVLYVWAEPPPWNFFTDSFTWSLTDGRLTAAVEGLLIFDCAYVELVDFLVISDNFSSGMLLTGIYLFA